MVRDRIGLGEVGVESRLTLSRSGLGTTHALPNHSPRGPGGVNLQQVAEDEYERCGHQEQEPSNPSTVHIYESSCGCYLFNLFKAAQRPRSQAPRQWRPASKLSAIAASSGARWLSLRAFICLARFRVVN